LKCVLCLNVAEVRGFSLFSTVVGYYCAKCNRSWRHDPWREQFVRCLKDLRRYPSVIEQAALERQVNGLENRIRGLKG
jgi:hypothetical protein